MRATTGRRIRCMNIVCPNYLKIWVLRPVEIKEPGKLKSDLHTWPKALCNECGGEPLFIGYVEEEKES